MFFSKIVAGAGLALCLGCEVNAGIRYGVGNWPENDRGNHRAVIEVADKSDAVLVEIPWRRSDEAPETKAVIIYAENGKKITNLIPLVVDKDFHAVIETNVPGLYILTDKVGIFRDNAYLFIVITQKSIALYRHLRCGGLP